MFTLEVRADVALRAAWLLSGVLGSRNLRVHGTLEALQSGLLVHLFHTPADLNAGAHYFGGSVLCGESTKHGNFALMEGCQRRLATATMP